MRRFAAVLACAAGLSTLFPSLALACACGCGIFDVGDGTLMPTDSASGFSAWFRYAYMDQNQNWENGAKAPASDNGDKQITTSFYTVGGEYRVNHSWTVMAELPIFQRALTTTDDGTVFGAAGSVYTGHITDLGDLQVTGVYTGLSPDMSTGLSFGMKLPTGNYTGPNGPLGGSEFDRDSLPGTGSTDVMLGGYHVGKLTDDGAFTYFAQARYQFAVLTRDSYRPGNELDAAVGVNYNFGAVGPFAKVSPLLQLLNSYRDHDSGANADPLNSGYERVLISPGVDLRLNKVRVSADVSLPIYQHTNAAANLAIEGTSGQLVAPALFKVQLGYDF
jgi:hypothetical protein